MRNHLKTYLLALAVGLCALGAFAQKPERPKWEDLRYADFYTFKNRETFTKDPWTWGYTKEFAERFHMPTQWIEPELKGILAVAFRVTDFDERLTCGLGGNPDNCWQGLTCQFEIYYDNRIKLPWVKDAPERDSFAGHVASRRSLGSTTSTELIDALIARYGKGSERNSYLQPISIGLSDGTGFGRQFLQRVYFYDQKVLPDMGLISFKAGACPAYQFRAGNFWVDFFESNEQQKNSKDMPRDQLKTRGLMYEATLPESYMKRVNQAALAGQAMNDSVMNRLLQNFQNRK